MNYCCLDYAFHTLSGISINCNICCYFWFLFMLISFFSNVEYSWQSRFIDYNFSPFLIKGKLQSIKPPIFFMIGVFAVQTNWLFSLSNLLSGSYNSFMSILSPTSISANLLFLISLYFYIVHLIGLLLRKIKLAQFIQ